MEETVVLDFYVREGDDLGLLGYFIGENETLKTLCVRPRLISECKEQIKNFLIGMQRCKSLVTYFGPMSAEIASSLTALPMLEKVCLWTDRGRAIDRQGCTALSRLLSNATTMKELNLSGIGLGDDDLKV